MLPILYAPWILIVPARVVHSNKPLHAGASISFAGIKRQHTTDIIVICQCTSLNLQYWRVCLAFFALSSLASLCALRCVNALRRNLYIYSSSTLRVSWKLNPSVTEGQIYVKCLRRYFICGLFCVPTVLGIVRTCYN